MLNSYFMVHLSFRSNQVVLPKRHDLFSKLGGTGKKLTIFILNIVSSQSTIPHKRILQKLANLVCDSFYYESWDPIH